MDNLKTLISELLQTSSSEMKRRQDTDPQFKKHVEAVTKNLLSDVDANWVWKDIQKRVEPDSLRPMLEWIVDSSLSASYPDYDNRTAAERKADAKQIAQSARKLEKLIRKNQDFDFYCVDHLLKIKYRRDDKEEDLSAFRALRMATSLPYLLNQFSKVAESGPDLSGVITKKPRDANAPILKTAFLLCEVFYLWLGSPSFSTVARLLTAIFQKPISSDMPRKVWVRNAEQTKHLPDNSPKKI